MEKNRNQGFPVEASNQFVKVCGVEKDLSSLSSPKSPVRMTGKWNFKLFDGAMNLKQVNEGYNVITTAGTEFLSSFFNSAATAASTFTMRYIALGTDATGEAASDTALGVEISRHTAVVSNNSSSIFEIVATFAPGSGTGAIAEYGLFSSNTAGTMLSRDTEPVINKQASDTLEVTAQITLS